MSHKIAGQLPKHAHKLIHIFTRLIVCFLECECDFVAQFADHDLVAILLDLGRHNARTVLHVDAEPGDSASRHCAVILHLLKAVFCLFEELVDFCGFGAGGFVERDDAEVGVFVDKLVEIVILAHLLNLCVLCSQAN